MATVRRDSDPLMFPEASLYLRGLIATHLWLCSKNVRFGSTADRRRLIQHVRLLADFGRGATHGLSPLGAMNGHLVQPALTWLALYW